MTEGGARPRRKKVWKYLLSLAVLGFLLLGFLSWYINTDSFQSMVRRRLVAELARITGGRVELASIHTVPFRFRVEVRNLTIHGKEDATQVPYAHVDGLIAEVKLISVLGAEFGFNSLVLERPVIHLITYPDGTTNQPEPRVRATGNPVEKLFSLSIDQLEARNGEFIWNDQKLPLDFHADDIRSSLSYSLLRRRYDGQVLLGKVDTKYKDMRPLAWMFEAHFLLGSNSLQVTSLKASSGKSHIEAGGRVDDFLQPKIAGTYKIYVNLGEAAAIARRPELRDGSLQAEGKGSWSMQEIATAGKLIVKDFDWQDANLGVRDASFSTSFDLSPQRLMLKQIQAKIFGGEVSGEAEVDNWRAAPETTRVKGRISDEQKGSVRLRVKDVSLAELAAGLSSRSRPIARLNLAGGINATVESRWRGSPRNAEMDVSGEAVPPARTGSGQLPVAANANFTYRLANEELVVNNLDAKTRATQIHASGTFSTRAAMHLSVRTSDLGEWQSVLSGLGYPERIPVTLQGEASFVGNATGKLSAINLAGRLESQNFDFLVPATSHRPEREVAWDSLVADLQLSPSGFAARHGALRHGDTTVNFDLTAGLQERQFLPSSSFTAHVNLQNADVAEIAAIVGYDGPLTGRMNLRLDAAGTKEEPQGTGKVLIWDATYGNEPIRRLESNLQFAASELTLSDARLAYRSGQVAGSGTYDFSSHAFRFDVNGSGFDLADFSRLQASRLAVGGRLDFHAQGSGSREEPEFNAKLQIHDLAFDREVVGNYSFDAVTRGADMHLVGHSQFKDAELSISGDVHLRDDWSSNVNLHFNHLDVDPLIRGYLKGRVTGHSAAAGDLQLQGPLRKPSELQVTGDLTDFYADVEHIQLRNNGPIRFTLSKQSLAIQQFRLIGEGTDLTLDGTVELAGDHALDFRASGRASLQLIESYDPDFTSSGVLAVNVVVGGTIAHPTMQGRLQVTGGSIAYVDLPSALSDINGSLIFNQDRLQIETLTAHVGGGLVEFGGYATAYNRQLNFDLNLKGQDVRLRYPPGVSSMMNMDLRFAGASNASTLSGEATVTKLSVTPGFDFGAYLERAAQSTAIPQTNPLLNRIRLDVHIVTLPELQMQTAVVRLSGDADLRMRGTAAKPVLLGRADIIEGEIYFNGTKYRLERGDVTFTNPVTTKPVLDLQASTHVREYDITVNLNGEFDRLNMTYHSEPPLPTADIISLLAVGQTQEQSAQLQSSGQSSFAQQASSAALAEALNSALSSRSRSLFGISHIKVDPQGLNTETSPTTSSPAVTIEQQVKDNLTITYTTNVSQTSQQIIQAEYNVTRNVSVLAIRDYNGVVSFELRVRRRKK